jgi:hypothetical protein
MSSFRLQGDAGSVTPGRIEVPRACCEGNLHQTLRQVRVSDPRLNGSHLSVARRDQYDATVDDMLDDRGPITAEADPLARLPSIPRTIVFAEAPTPGNHSTTLIRRAAPPPGGTYTLVSLADGRRHPLRVGINAVGRYLENDLVLYPFSVSRRHCVILVHATGGCEVYDTASRNGTWVNQRRIGRVDLFPGDTLMVSSQQFLVVWVGPDGELLPDTEGSETACNSGLSGTG